MNVKVRIVNHGAAIAMPHCFINETSHAEQTITIDVTNQVDKLIDKAICEFARQQEL